MITLEKLDLKDSKVKCLKIDTPVVLKGYYFYNRYIETVEEEVTKSKLFGIIKTRHKETKKVNHYNVVVKEDPSGKESITYFNTDDLRNNKSIVIATCYGGERVKLGKLINNRYELVTIPSLTITYDKLETYPEVCIDPYKSWSDTDKVITKTCTKNVKQTLYFQTVDEIKEFILNILLKEKYLDAKGIYIDNSNNLIKYVKKYIEDYDK